MSKNIMNNGQVSRWEQCKKREIEEQGERAQMGQTSTAFFQGYLGIEHRIIPESTLRQ